MFLWFPPSCGFHLLVVSTFLWFPPCVVTLWFAPSCCLHLPMVTPWCPFRGLHFCGLHSAVVSTLPWFPPSLWLLRGVPFVVCTFVVYTLPWFPPSRGLHLCMVPTLPVVIHGVPFVVCTITWFTLCRGFHPPVVCIFAPTLPVVTSCCPFRGLHHHVVYTAVVSTLLIFTWFPPSRGYSVVSILDFGLN